MPDWYWPSGSEAEKKTQPGVKAAVAKPADGEGSTNTFGKAVVTTPGDGGGPTNTVTMGMDEIIEFAQEFARRSSAEASTPFKICGR